MEAEQCYIALIDLSCNEEFLELVKSSLLAVIESLPGNARLGLITFSTKVRTSEFLSCPSSQVVTSMLKSKWMQCLNIIWQVQYMRHGIAVFKASLYLRRCYSLPGLKKVHVQMKRATSACRDFFCIFL